MPIFLPTCNVVKDTALAEKEVTHFLSLFDAKELVKIFDTALPEFQPTQSKEDLIHFSSVVRRKTGTFKSISKNGRQANSVNNKTNIALTCSTAFKNGDDTETFTYYRWKKAKLPSLAGTSPPHPSS